MRNATCIVSMLLLLPACAGRSRVNEPQDIKDREPSQLQVRLELSKRAYDVGERIYCTLKIANKFKETVSIPDISITSGKGDTWPEGIVLCVKHKVLRIVVKREGQPLEMRQKWQAELSGGDYLPVIRLIAGEEVEAKFFLTAPWEPKFFSIERTGNHTVKVILDTTKYEDNVVWNGRVSTNSASFAISQVPIFRDKKVDESERNYAKARTEFYLDRILQGKGEYFRNVSLILQTKECGWGLISMFESQDTRKVGVSKQILEAIHSQPWQDSERKVLPKSREGWIKWWNSTGSKKSPEELWHNFDSHHQ